MAAVAIASQLGVPFTTLLSVALLGERIRWRRWSGIALSFAGVLVLGFNPAVLQSWAGLALIVAAALIGAFGVVAIKRIHDVEPLELQAWFCWGSLPVLLPLSLWLEVGQRDALLQADPIGIGAVLYSALVASLFAHTAFFAWCSVIRSRGGASHGTRTVVQRELCGLLLGDRWTGAW